MSTQYMKKDEQALNQRRQRHVRIPSRPSVFMKIKIKPTVK